MTSANRRRVVITGMGVVSPFGLSPDDLWSGLVEARSAVAPIGLFCTDGLPLHHGAEARAFTGEIDNFGPLESETKKAIRKGLKVMCRESQMAVAAAQRALHDCGLPPAARVPERFGCVFGSDYMLTLPEDFTAGVAACRSETSDFDFDRWAADGMPLLNPLWLLKYLPNMPASHIAIYNDLRGPSNSLTVREASGHAAVAEATMTIQRGAADVMLAGATGTRVHPMKTVHALQSEQVALGPGDPTAWSRPFDRLRQGMVLGEGAAVLVLEELGHARKRGATIHGEVLGYASRHVADRRNIGRRREALASALRRALEMAALPAGRPGHVHAFGLGTVGSDREEAAALEETLGAGNGVPVVAAKANVGNLGAAAGLSECVASLRALRHGTLFPLLNHREPDPECPIRSATAGDEAGGSFVSMSVTPQGQAGAVVIGTVE